jgi:hypothetical protein
MNTESLSLCDTSPPPGMSKTLIVNGKYCNNYNVHREYNDTKAAAVILQKLTEKTDILIEHLKNKYLQENDSSGVDPSKNNRIDVIQSSELFPTSSPSYENLYASSMTSVAVREFIQERVEQLMRNYSSDRIYEISPLNSAGVTSYAEDKKTLILCLRKKEPNTRGEYELHDVDLLVFVLLHELSHMACACWQHPTQFWELFKFMLMNASEAGIYTPVDFNKYPTTYCGLRLSYNPVFDNKL